MEVKKITLKIVEKYEIRDMPKLESPFIRKQKGKRYLVTPEIAEGYEWVFNDPEVLATEKLNGTNVSIVINDGIIKSVWNRENRVPHIIGNRYILEGLIESHSKKYIPKVDGQFFGELIGNRVQSNDYKLDNHIWIPFFYLRKKYSYKSFHNYPKTFENISNWFEKDIFSLFMKGRGGVTQFPEGIVFYQPSTHKMAKLRRDMFDWNYK